MQSLTSASPADDVAAKDSSMDGIDGERARARIQRREAEVESIELRVPLRRRILAALADRPATTSELAAALEAATASVSRLLAAMRDDDLVEFRQVEGDGRRRQYLLTREGEVHLRKHRAFGQREDPSPRLGQDQMVDFLSGGVQNAVALRRKTNKLDDAIARLRTIVKQAETAEAPELLVEALTELGTSLRQNRCFDEAQAVTSRLGMIALGQDNAAPATLALPAAAHSAYAIGRLIESQGRGLTASAEHLTTAARLYGQLAEASGRAHSAAWREREAWSLIGLADNFRARSQFESALSYAARALTLFGELDDPYGRSRCLFMFGFCMRLLGDFDGAWSYLTDAYELAKVNSFERFQADSLAQMGEVRRCQGRVGEAREMLDEAIDRSRYMKFAVTQAFAQSARGAVDYQKRDFDQAVLALGQAHNLFLTCQHCEGRALNARRQAVVARCIGMQSSGASDAASRFIEYSLEGYTQLQSPAGIAACEIERGRQQLQRFGEAPEAVVSLTQRLKNPEQRDYLELDPWVPSVLHAFVVDLDDQSMELHDLANSLVKAAPRKLAERMKYVIQDDGATIEQAWQKLDTNNAAEMAGETRYRAAPELVASMGGIC